MTATVSGDLVADLNRATLARDGRRLPSDEILFRCPGHQPDEHPSARWNPTKGVWHCDACQNGGGAIDLHRRIGSDPIPFAPRRQRRAAEREQAKRPEPMTLEAEYDYQEQDGTILHQVRRFQTPTGKTFRQRRPNGSGGWINNMDGVPPVPYGLVELAAAPDALVFLVEGEKCVHAIRDAGGVATTNSGGAGKWSDVHSQFLAGRHLAILPDHDEPGEAHARQVLESVGPVAASVQTIRLPGLPPKGDITDWLAVGHTLDDLIALVDDDPPPFVPASPAASATTPVSSPAARLVTLSDVVPERIDWLLRGRLPFGKLTVIEGDPGLGKSSLTLSLAGMVSTGSPLPGETDRREPAGVVLLSAEDGLADTVRPRLEAAGADLSRIVALTGVPDGDTDRPVAIPHDVARIEQAVASLGAKLVIIDPIMAYLGGDVNSNRDQDVRRALAALASMADRTGVCLVLVRHLNKAAGASALYRGGGSIGIAGAARSVLLVARDPDDDERRLVASVKSNLAHEAETLAFRLQAVPGSDVAHVRWEGTSHHRADALVRPVSDEAEPKSRLEEAKAFLRAELAGGARPSGEIISAGKREGISERTLRDAREALKIKPQRDGFGKGGVWVWRLPPDAIDAPLGPKMPIDAVPGNKGIYAIGGTSMADDDVPWPGRIVSNDERETTP